MSDKTFELMEKMYIEFNGKFESLEKEIKNIKHEVKDNSKSIIILEHKISNKLGAIYDAQDTTNERLDRIEKKLDKISAKVENHEIRIHVLEGGKNKKTI